LKRIYETQSLVSLLLKDEIEIEKENKMKKKNDIVVNSIMWGRIK
jgi:hypothetical protein